MASFGDSTARHQARVHNGNVYNLQTYNYTVKRQSEDAVLQQAQTNGALLSAAADGETSRVAYLITERLADRDHCDSDGLTALHHACLSGFEDTVKLLLDFKLHANALSPRYGSPLCLAVIKSRRNVIDILLAHGARADRSGGYIGSPVHAACHQDDVEILAELLKHGAPPDQFAIVQADLCNRLHYQGILRQPGKPRYFETQPLATAARHGRIEMVKLLVTHGALTTTTYRGWMDDDRIGSTYDTAPPDSRRWFDFTSLSGAALSGNVDLVKFLLSEATKPQCAITSEQKGAASWSGCGAWVKTFTRAQRFLNAQDSRGWTALMAATIESNLGALQVLMDAGAKIEAKDKDGRTAVHLAAQHGKPTSIYKLLQSGASLEATDFEGRTPICIAAGAGRNECVQVLLEQGVSLTTTNKAGRGVLFEAVKARDGCENVIESLIKAGCDVNKPAVDDNMSTLLGHAAEFGNMKAVRTLLALGADPAITDGRGLLPHEVANRPGRKRKREILLRAFNEKSRSDEASKQIDPASEAPQAMKSEMYPIKLNAGALPVRHRSPAGEDHSSGGPGRAAKPSSKSLETRRKVEAGKASSALTSWFAEGPKSKSLETGRKSEAGKGNLPALANWFAGGAHSGGPSRAAKPSSKSLETVRQSEAGKGNKSPSIDFLSGYSDSGEQS
ncbi:serine threonine- phosphatase 6 regulatory ankyrin repeat subunit B-like [Lecanosticta acicola]|uniref:Serine threonine- phosphatase 6 regulatory ankyrin repeat subunit B-like n=1 Tax=Lecanosticta acicola TaxID=111012 RepID=A0AAI8VVD9_9PEZI|nr:serine threonine- phosphatase 6 regulatory ankyrin repeat subunit B-like [Lecanosticta acicola]